VSVNDVEGGAGSYGVDDLADFLIGRWSVDRRVEDRLLNVKHHFSGVAEISYERDDIWYRETGVFRVQGAELVSAQARRYVPQSSAVVDVYFADGRFFHNLDLRDGTWCCVHLCGSDRYEGETSAHDVDHWTTLWRVTGLQKNLTLITHYRRRAG